MSTDSSQMNFNPSWMQPSAPLKSVERPNGFICRSSTEETEEMIEPVFANHRYGREDLLALVGKDSTKPPDGLEKCPFYVDKAQVPIVTLAQNDTETRLQQNINSSKALSALTRQDRHHMMANGSEVGSPSSGGNNSGWVVAGSNRTGGAHGHKPPAQQNSRWSSLAPSSGGGGGSSGGTSDTPYRSSYDSSGKGRTNAGTAGGGTQSSFSRTGGPRLNSENRPASSNRFRVPSTSIDRNGPNPPATVLNENVAKLLESQPPPGTAQQQPPAASTSSSTANILAKIGVSSKGTSDNAADLKMATGPDSAGHFSGGTNTGQSGQDEWQKFSLQPVQSQKPNEGMESAYSDQRGTGSINASNHTKSASPPDAYASTIKTEEDRLRDLEIFRKGMEEVMAPFVNDAEESDRRRGVMQMRSKNAPTPAISNSEHNKWTYLDPSGIQRGPFEVQQMQTWYENGYFDANLRLRRVTEKDYVTLGELFHTHGTVNPFVSKSEPINHLATGMVNEMPGNRQQAPGSSHHSPRIDAANIWTSISSTNSNNMASTASSNIVPDFSSILSDVAAAGNMRSGSVGMKQQQDIELENMLRAKEQQIMEGQRKLREKEECLRREDRDREEKERRVREMEMELKRKQEELQKIAMEKEQELENRRMQVAEFERQRREALERMEEKIRNDQIQQMRRKEEEDRRRAQEMEERMYQEKERQRLMFEAEAQKRKREEEEAKIRLAYEEARRLQEMALESARRVEEEQKYRLLEEHQQRVRKEAEEAKAVQEAERKRKKEEQVERKRNEEQQRQEKVRKQKEEDELNRAAIEALLSESPSIKMEKAAPAPWVTVGGGKPSVKKGNTPTQQQPRSDAEKQQQKSLLEIQQEEQRDMQEKLKKQQELFDAHRKNAQAEQRAAATQKSPWGTPTQVFPASSALGQDSSPPLPPPQIVQNSKAGSGSSQQQQQQQQSSSGRVWNPVPTAQAAPIPKGKSTQQPQPKTQKKPKADIKLPVEKPKKPDVFTAWIIKRIRELNSSVDAEVFATFIEGVDNPNESEDYIVGYLGESKVVKDFHKEFLNKRIELRPRVVPTAKDDLSAAAAAYGTGSFTASTGSNGAGASHGNSSNSHSASSTAAALAVESKKKKKGGRAKVIDGASLGFRPSGDPNRVNAGEIDTAPPVPTGRKNR